MSQIEEAIKNIAKPLRFSGFSKFYLTLFFVIIFYLLLTVFLTWPLILKFGSYVPDGPPEDRFQNFWNFWWTGRALLNFQNPFQTNALFYPYYNGGANPTIPLYLHTLQLFNSVLVLPVTALFGVAAAYNVLIFFAFTMSGLGAFLLGRHLTRNLWAGLLAGIVYTFSEAHFGSVTTSITNIMSIQWLPFYVLSLQLWHERRDLKWAGIAGVFLALAAYTDWYNTIFLVFYTIFFFIVTSFPKNWLKQSPGVAFALLVGGILGAPIIIPAFFTLGSPIFAAQLDFNRDIRSSNSLMEFINPLGTVGALFWVGLLVGVGLYIAGGKWRKAAVYWSGFYLLCSLFTLGPRLQIERVGEPTPTAILLPYALLKFVPGASVMRSPDRFDIPGQLGLAIAFAFALAWVSELSNKYQVSGIKESETRNFLPSNNQQLATNNSILTQNSKFKTFLLLLFAIPYLLLVNIAPLDLVQVKPSGFVSSLPKSGNYAILELPITRHYNFDHERMLNQIYHKQPIMGGYLSRPVTDPYRFPDSPFRYLADQSYVYGDDPNKEIFAAKHTFAQLDNILKLYNFRYVVLYKDDYKQEKERKGNRELIERVIGPGNLIYEDEHNLLFKVPDSFGPSEIVTTAIFTGNGWYKPEQNADGPYRWTEQQADLYLTVSQPQKIKLSLTALAFGDDRTMLVSLNNQKLYEGRVTPAPGLIEFEFEASPGTMRLTFQSQTPAQSAKDLGQGNDTRPLAFLIRNISFNNSAR